MRGSHANRKATKAETRSATQVIKQAFPNYDVVWGGHGDYGGHRAPRDHTISFRLRDGRGKYRSNVIWLMPDWLGGLTVESVKNMVERGNGM